MNTINNYPSVGTELKININAEPICGYSMADYDFVCKFFASNGNNFVEIPKNEMIQMDSDNYIALVDTALIGHGELSMRMTAYIPDTAFADGLRTEVVMVNTGITIKR